MIFTDEQQKIVDYIFEQLALGKDGKNIIISGSGGTGKTEMITEVICILINQGYRVAVAAMTGKATAVLRQKIHKKLWDKGMTFRDDDGEIMTTFPKDNLLIETVQKITKQSKIVNVNEAGETIYSNTWKDPTHFMYDIFVIDELSMVPQYLSIWWQKTNARVIGLGDFCQLPEVTSEDNKKELYGFKHDLKIELGKLTYGYGVKVLKNLAQLHLTKVLRSDNEVALLSQDLRDFTKGRRQVKDIIRDWAKKAPGTVKYSQTLSDLEMGTDWQIICYTNKMCAAINEAACIGGDYPVDDDKILLFDNIPPIQKFNGDTLTLRELTQAINKYNASSKNHDQKITVILKWKGKMPTSSSKYRIEREMAVQYRLFKEALARAQTLRMNKLPTILLESGYSKIQVDQWIEEINQIRSKALNDGEAFSMVIDQFYEIERELAQTIMEKSPRLPRMYIVTIDYGYAITVHKSQGSQYPKVCYVMDRFDHPLLYTAVSRAEKEIKVIDLLKD